MKRDCISYVTAPKNKFNRLVASFGSSENYQKYLAGYDPLNDKEYLNSQKSDQKDFDEVKIRKTEIMKKEEFVLCD